MTVRQYRTGPLLDPPWVRLVTLRGWLVALEMRDPNSGQDQSPAPASKPRHQYVIAAKQLWSRILPPAPLDEPQDESRWADEPQDESRTTSAWSPLAPGIGLPWEWAESQGLDIRRKK